MLTRYAAAILGSLGTVTVLASYVVMYNDGQGVIPLGLLGFALIGSAMLTQRVRDLTLEVEDLDHLQMSISDRWEDIHRLRRTVRDLKAELCDADSEAGAQRLKIENLEWELAGAKLAAEDWKQIFEGTFDLAKRNGAFDA